MRLELNSPLEKGKKLMTTGRLESNLNDYRKRGRGITRTQQGLECWIQALKEVKVQRRVIFDFLGEQFEAKDRPQFDFKI